MEIKITLGAPADLDEIYRLRKLLMDGSRDQHYCFRVRENMEQPEREFLLERMKNDKLRVFLAETEAGKSVGMLIADVREWADFMEYHKKGYIAETVVDAEWRGHNIGEKLVAAAEKWLISQGVDHIDLMVSTRNPRGEKFWGRMGYTPYLQTFSKKIR